MKNDNFNEEVKETNDFRSLQNIMSFSRELRSKNLDMYVANRLLCMAYIFSELPNPTDEELMVITTVVMDAWYRSDCIQIETLIRYLLEKYTNKKYTPVPIAFLLKVYPSTGLLISSRQRWACTGARLVSKNLVGK